MCVDKYTPIYKIHIYLELKYHKTIVIEVVRNRSKQEIPAFILLSDIIKSN